MGLDNAHLVRTMLDGVFGRTNFCSQVVFRKTTGKGSQRLDNTYDVILWFAKDIAQVKYRPTTSPVRSRMIRISGGSNCRTETAGL